MGFKIQTNTLMPTIPKWDLFCDVVDNFGDIGVCWRLAKQLCHEHGYHVRLWVNNLHAFQHICQQINPQLKTQFIAGVEIKAWNEGETAFTLPNVVVEAFACRLPAAYIYAMEQAINKPLWINLEYLTFEKWSVSCHTLPSPQPNQLKKYFFFTGLPETGGLIRETKLIADSEQFQKELNAQEQFLKTLTIHRQPNTQLILLFSYPHQNLSTWLTTLQHSLQNYHLIIPNSPVLETIADYLGCNVAHLKVGTVIRQKNLTFQIIPFIDQNNFDHLLWCCDLNIVRGEDSFVRALWAGKPLIWMLYPQQEGAHLVKLAAFLEYYTQHYPHTIKEAIINLWTAWNKPTDLSNAWQHYASLLPDIRKLAKNWTLQQETETNLTTKLANFYKNRL